VERALGVYDEVFGPAAARPEDLAGRTAVFDERMERLASELPAHIAFEGTAMSALQGMGRSFHAISKDHSPDDETWLNRTAETYREEGLDNLRVFLGPRDLSASWGEHEATTDDAFSAGRKEAAGERTLAETESVTEVGS
jgi:hypothetical protein